MGCARAAGYKFDYLRERDSIRTRHLRVRSFGNSISPENPKRRIELVIQTATARNHFVPIWVLLSYLSYSDLIPFDVRTRHAPRVIILVLLHIQIRPSPPFSSATTKYFQLYRERDESRRLNGRFLRKKFKFFPRLVRSANAREQRRRTPVVEHRLGAAAPNAF